MPYPKSTVKLPPPQPNERCRYRPPGDGLKSWRVGLLISINRKIAKVRAGTQLIEVPPRHIKPLKPFPRRPPVARLVPPATGTPAVQVLILDPRFSPPLPQDKPGGRVIDLAYERTVRLQSCCLCPQGEDQRTQTEVHHYGPRPKGRKTHSLFCNPVCALCHRQFHAWRAVGGRSISETAVILLQWQGYNLVTYFAGQLEGDSRSWEGLIDVAAHLPEVTRPCYLRAVLDLLFQRLTGRGV